MYLDAIQKFEGYSARANWDYAQHSNGFGTKALYAGEVIDRAEAERRFSAEISKAEEAVERFAPGLDAGTKAALTSLTFNAGTTWMRAGLGDAIRSGDLETAREKFLKYNKAGGDVLPGLVSRRFQEADWIASPAGVAQAPASIDEPGRATGSSRALEHASVAQWANLTLAFASEERTDFTAKTRALSPGERLQQTEVYRLIASTPGSVWHRLDDERRDLERQFEGGRPNSTEAV